MQAGPVQIFAVILFEWNPPLNKVQGGCTAGAVGHFDLAKRLEHRYCSGEIVVVMAVVSAKDLRQRTQVQKHFQMDRPLGRERQIEAALNIRMKDELRPVAL